MQLFELKSSVIAPILYQRFIFYLLLLSYILYIFRTLRNFCLVPTAWHISTLQMQKISSSYGAANILKSVCD
jgi:hypothetical protein